MSAATAARAVLIVLSAALALLPAARDATAAPPPPAQLEVAEGDGWLRVRQFGLTWSNPSSGVAAVRYLLRDPLGAIAVGPTRIDHAVARVTGVDLPPAPGIYTAEVWLEDGAGAQGARASTRVRFDDVRPGSGEPLVAPGWIGRAELPFRLQVAPPPGPQPLSGIRGYAVSISPRDDAEPCADRASCSEAEVDLRGGIDDDSLVVPELPHGVSHVRVVAVSGSGMHSPSSGHASLRVDRIDPTSRVSGEPAGWVNHAVVLRAAAADTDSGMDPDGGAFTAIRVDEHPPVVSPGDSAATAIVESGVHAIAFYARDRAGNINDGRVSNGRLNPPPGRATVKIDRDPPQAFLVGSVGPRDPETIEARVADQLSGPHPSRGSIAVRAVGSNQPFAPLPTAIRAGVLSAHWPADEYARGEYEFRVVGFDAAGNQSASTRKANGAPLVLPSPLKVEARLWAALDGHRQTTVGAGREVVIEGALGLASGESAPGSSITVVEVFDPGANREPRLSLASADVDGRFELRLAPGPSRTVTARFAGNRFATGASSDRLRVGVRPAIALRSSAAVAVIGGRPVIFSGRVDSSARDLPEAGLAIQLQFRLHGGRWREFRTLHSDRRGRFRYRYAFSDDDSRGVRFEFRALAPTQSDWPYEPGGSRPVAVRGA